MKMVPYVKTIIGDTHTPITVFQRYVGDKIGFLLESKSTQNNRFSFIGKNSKTVISASHKEQTLKSLQYFLDTYQIENNTKLPFIGGVVGIVSYEFAAKFFFVTEFIAYDHDYGKILFVALGTDDIEGKLKAEKTLEKMQQEFKKPLGQSSTEEVYIGESTSNMSKEEFMEKVEKVKEHIKSGDASQVVISQRWSVPSNMKPFQLYRNLRSLNPSPYLFYYNFGDCQVAGSSPEMLVEIKDNQISTCPIAGTRVRGANDKEDLALEKELLDDPKEVSEHKMLVNLAKDDMSLVADKESIQVKDYMQVHKYSHVMHITSLVQGEKRKEVGSLDVLDAFFPAGTLSGSPREKAKEIIEELEDEKRGFYGGAAGYIGCNGDMDMCIAIRMMVIKDEMIYMQAGAGIVADSDPETEYEESENKVKAMKSAIYLRSD